VRGRLHPPDPKAPQVIEPTVIELPRAGHSNAKITGLYNRRNDDISAGEMERIGI
jgi:hypothetical protein